MKEHEITAAVRRAAGLDDNDDAARVTRATLSVLGRRLAGQEPRDLASQLPPATAEALPDTGGGEAFRIADFYRRVAEAEGSGCTEAVARDHARAVLSVVREAVTDGEFDNMTAQLPGDYRRDLLRITPTDGH